MSHQEQLAPSEIGFQFALGFSDPVTVRVPRAHLDLSIQDAVREALSKRNGTDPAVASMRTVLSEGSGIMFERANRYHGPAATVREVLGLGEQTAADQETDQGQRQDNPSVVRALRPQRGGAPAPRS